MISAFDLFQIDVGPSRAHAVTPMRAAHRFAAGLQQTGQLHRTDLVRVELYGSLGAASSDNSIRSAVRLGLSGRQSESTAAADNLSRVQPANEDGRVPLPGGSKVGLELILHPDRLPVPPPGTTLPSHPNAVRFTALDAQRRVVTCETYYVVGNGLLLTEAHGDMLDALPHPFHTGEQLLDVTVGRRISDVVLANEAVGRTEEFVASELLTIWKAMQASVHRGCHTPGMLPGVFDIPRRAPRLRRTLERDEEPDTRALDWVALFALAVAEENAAGGRVVTAPTSGAAGVVPAVLYYYLRFVPRADDEGVVRFLLAAAAIGSLIKTNICCPHAGCQDEVGTACAMAAGGLAEVLGGTPGQVENAAEIAIEQHLGLTCAPAGGQPQVPCIQRNAVAAVKAVTAARLACHPDTGDLGSLDTAIKTMRAMQVPG